MKNLKDNGEDFINEVASISRTFNIVNYFMSNGSFEKIIYEGRSDSVCQLDWPILHKIALGIARGLEYLNCGCTTLIFVSMLGPQGTIGARKIVMVSLWSF
uniref:Serine-threonine/tyrosine-protein kinase catalytic domain-containing protein n=1 Tax=Solanum lycopersicum TaxID=4081 RepID=A0A3Q7GF88_SOLLC